VVADRAGADDAVASEELQFKGASVAWAGQSHAIGTSAQRAERAVVDQFNEELRELELPAAASARDLLRWSQLRVETTRGPGREAA
jgi:hypothetical protein